MLYFAEVGHCVRLFYNNEHHVACLYLACCKNEARTIWK